VCSRVQAARRVPEASDTAAATRLLHPCFPGNHMEKLQRDFLWSGTDAPKVHMVKWSKVCMPVHNGGLGV